MIRVAWFVIRSNERVILPKTNGTDIKGKQETEKERDRGTETKAERDRDREKEITEETAFPPKE